MRPLALALLSALYLFTLDAAEIENRVFAAIPSKLNPMIVVSFVWKSGKGLPDYREMAKNNDNDPLTIWSKMQVAMDNGDMAALSACYNAESKNDISMKIKSGDFRNKAEERRGLNIEISGTALMEDFSFVAYVLNSPKYGKFPWVNIVTGPSPWLIDSTVPINSSLNMAVVSWSYAEHNSDLLINLPKDGFNYGTLGIRTGLSQ